MTQLSKLSNARRYIGENVIALKEITAFYVHTGRNAWHSTWIARYSPGCMHTTLKSAKSYAETKRVQGTTFNISELPALMISSSIGSVVVTQINSSNPLDGYSRSAVRATHHRHTLMEGHLNDYLCIGAPIYGAILSFEGDSRFWKHPPPHSNSLIITETPETDPETVEIKTDILKYKSFSQGGQYTMGWKTHKSDVSPSGIAGLRLRK